MTTITQISHLSMTEIASTSDTNFTNSTSAQICLPGTTISEIITNLTSSNTQAITFDQIELAMVSFGLNPMEDSDSYKLIIDTLERQQILVVDSLDHDQLWTDENAAAHDLADEAWEILKKSRASIDEYNHPLLTADNERRLIEIYQIGIAAENTITDDISFSKRRSIERQIEAGKQALDEIMRCNLRLITKIAFRYAPRINHLTLDDLVQEGRIGLYKAIDKFDLSSNLRLSTYATWWIRQAISRAIAESDRTIRLPVHVYETLYRIKRERQRFLNKTGREPNRKEIAKILGVAEKKIEILLQMEKDAYSLDRPIRRGEYTTIGELIPDSTQIEPSHLIQQSAIYDSIMSFLNHPTIDYREKQIILLRFGLEGKKIHTLEEIGQHFGVTRERIRQIEVKALRKLKKLSFTKKLQDFLY